jgi:HEAT repeat protein
MNTHLWNWLSACLIAAGSSGDVPAAEPASQPAATADYVQRAQDLLQMLRCEGRKFSDRTGLALVKMEAPPDGALPVLRIALGDVCWRVRAGAAVLLGKAGPAATAVLVEALRDHDWRVREAAALGFFGMWPWPETAAPALGQALRHERVDSCLQQAGQALAAFGPGAAPARADVLAVLQDSGKEPARRVLAAHVLGNIGLTPATAEAGEAALLEMLGRKDPSESLAAAWALGAVARPGNRVERALDSAVASTDPNVSFMAKVALAKLAGRVEPILPGVIEKLGSRDETVRQRGILVLASLGPPAVPALVSALKNSREEVRTGAGEALGKMGPAGAKALLQCLRSDDSDLRYTGLSAISFCRPIPQEAIAEIVRACLDDDANTRWRAAFLLCLPESPGTAALLGHLDRGDLKTRCRAVEALGLARPVPHSVVVACHEMLTDSTPGVQDSAVASLGLAGTAGRDCAWALGRILSGLIPATPHVREQVPKALAAMGRPGVPALLAAGRDKDPALRAAVIEALGDVGPGAEPGIPLLVAALGDPAAEVRDKAVVALARISQPAKVVPLLARALTDGKAVLRAGAARALGEIGAPAAGATTALEAAATDTDENVKRDAQDALSDIGEDQAAEKQSAQSGDRLLSGPSSGPAKDVTPGK